jgi:DNA-binding NarL/FixJ family response regulator
MRSSCQNSGPTPGGEKIPPKADDKYHIFFLKNIEKFIHYYYSNIPTFHNYIKHMIKVVIIDDQTQDRNLISSILSAQQEIEITGFGKDGYDALRLSERIRPDVIIIALGKHGGEEAELVPVIKRKSPATKVLFLSGRGNNENAADALSAGALGYLIKKTDMDKLAASVKTVHNGIYVISPMIISRTFGMLFELNKARRTHRDTPVPYERRRVPANINRTERQIMAFIARGHSDKEIAENLRLKQGTVRNYLSSAMHKAGLKSRTQVVVYAITNGLIDTGEQAP